MRWVPYTAIPVLAVAFGLALLERRIARPWVAQTYMALLVVGGGLWLAGVVHLAGRW